MCKRAQLQSIDAIANPRHHVGGSAGIVFGNPSKDAIEVILRRFADDDFHTP
jgi:hypothetical protein